MDRLPSPQESGRPPSVVLLLTEEAFLRPWDLIAKTPHLKPNPFEETWTTREKNKRDALSGRRFLSVNSPAASAAEEEEEEEEASADKAVEAAAGSNAVFAVCMERREDCDRDRAGRKRGSTRNSSSSN